MTKIRQVWVKAWLPILTAIANGSKIQKKDANTGEWLDGSLYDNDVYEKSPDDFRIKPTSTYRPFKDGEELVAEFCKRFEVERKAGIEPSIWVLNEYYEDVHRRSMISDIDDDGVWFAGEARAVTCYSDFLDNYAFLDGSPCGVKEKGE